MRFGISMTTPPPRLVASAAASAFCAGLSAAGFVLGGRLLGSRLLGGTSLDRGGCGRLGLHSLGGRLGGRHVDGLRRPPPAPLRTPPRRGPLRTRPCVGARRATSATGLDQALAALPALAATGLDQALAAAGLDEARLSPAACSARALAGGAVGGPAGRQARLGGDLLTGRRERRDDVALVDPHLDADGADGGPGGRLTEVDVGPQRVQRHPALAVPLAAAHVGAAEAARALHPDALGAGLHGRLDGTLHGTAERHPALELVGDAAGQQLGVGLGVLDLDHVDLDDAIGQLLEAWRRRSTSEPLRPITTPGRAVWMSICTFLSPMRSISMRDTRTAGELLLEDLADRGVLDDLGGVVLVAVPTGLPVGDDAEAEAVRVDLLTH